MDILVSNYLLIEHTPMRIYHIPICIATCYASNLVVQHGEKANAVIYPRLNFNNWKDGILSPQIL